MTSLNSNTVDKLLRGSALEEHFNPGQFASVLKEVIILFDARCCIVPLPSNMFNYHYHYSIFPALTLKHV